MRSTNWLDTGQAVPETEKKKHDDFQDVRGNVSKTDSYINLRYSPPQIYFGRTNTLFSCCESN